MNRTLDACATLTDKFPSSETNLEDLDRRPGIGLMVESAGPPHVIVSQMGSQDSSWPSKYGEPFVSFSSRRSSGMN